ncbi:MAG: ribosome biogenesis GTP-binding protein YsxC [Dethiosulfovibrio peptidovorans]|nr:MAG: ribosome biogenesis GTP-binding protein YsxC [Dethiosulfovibrio peptidovorans]
MRWRASLVRTAFESGQFIGEQYPEIALAGRSNVGKSSLLNRLIDQKIAHISSKPGKTRSINFFEVNGAGDPFILVDLPGYGYAARSKKEQDQWRRLIERYMTTRRSLALVVHLVDFRHGLLKNDRELQEWVDGLGLPILTVFTKGDKVSRSKRKGELFRYIREGVRSVDVPPVTSAEDGMGLNELKRFIGEYLIEWRQYGENEGER